MKHFTKQLIVLFVFCLSASTVGILAQKVPQFQFKSSNSLAREFQMSLFPLEMDCNLPAKHVCANKHNNATANEPIDDYVTVTCVYTCDEFHKEEFASYYFVDENGNLYRHDATDASNEIQLPKSKYDIVAYYVYIENMYMNNQKIKYIFRENVDITKDTTIITNPDEANIHLQFEPRFPNGEVCCPETLLVNDNFSYEVHQAGNISDIYFDSDLLLRDPETVIVSQTGNWGNIWIGDIERNGTHITDIYTNEISNRFMFTCNMVFTRYEFDGILYVADFEASTISDTIITNNCDEYYLYESLFKQTPFGQNSSEGLFPGINLEPLYGNGEPHGGSQLISNIPLNKEEPFRCYINNCHQDQYQYLVNPLIADGKNQLWEQETLLIEPYIFIDSNNCIHTYCGTASTNNRNYKVKPDENSPSLTSCILNDWNPQFSYPIEKMKTITGNSCPIAVQMIQGMFNVPEPGVIMKYVQITDYIGRNGEWRESDIWASHTLVFFNGEFASEGDGLFYVGFKNGVDEGIVDMIVTNENVDVDGLPGKNVTNIHFDMAGDDNTSPTLQMLDFRDTEDNAIDRFATAEEGKLQFYCGDFNEQYIDSEYHPQYFVCNDLASVEVAYSPYQADTWTALDASEVAEYYYDGMGHYYAAPLASVTGKGLEGWFDLRIRLEDAAGNWQEQVISPAFRIDELAYSGIAAPRGSAAAHEVARYNLAGQRVDANATGIVIVKMSDGTARKVMVK